MTFELTNFGTSPVGTTANSLIAGNLPNFEKKYQISLKFRLDFVHFLNQYLEICRLMSSYKSIFRAYVVLYFLDKTVRCIL